MMKLLTIIVLTFFVNFCKAQIVNTVDSVIWVKFDTNYVMPDYLKKMMAECDKIYHFKNQKQYQKWRLKDKCGFRIVIIGKDTCYSVITN